MDESGISVIMPKHLRVARSPKKIRNPWQILLWVIPFIFLIYFFYQPLIAILKLIFSASIQQNAPSFDARSVLKPLSFTIFQALLSTLLTLAIGVPFAYLFSHFQFPGKNAFGVLSTLPFILPTVVVAAGFNALLGSRGWLNLGLIALFGLDQAPLQFVNSLGAILLAHIFYNTTIVIRLVSNAWSNMDQRLPMAARTLGAKPWRVFREVTLPLLSPSLLAAALLVFLFDFTSFGVILMLGGPGFETLEVAIYRQAFFNLNLPVAGVLSMVQLLFTLGIAIAHHQVVSRSLTFNQQNIERLAPRKPNRLSERILTGTLILILIMLILSPLAALVSRSFARLEPDRGERTGFRSGFTLSYYQELFTNRRGSIFYIAPFKALQNSLLYAAITILIAVPMGFLLAYALFQNARLALWLDSLIMLPLGASAVTLGLGFLIVFNYPPWNRPGFILLIPIAHALIALPFVVRTILPTMRNIPASIRESARCLGASPWQVFKEVELPILKRSLLMSAIFAFTISLGEFGAATFISTPENPTIPVAIFQYLSQPGGLNYGQAMAMSTILLMICGLGIAAIEKFKFPGEEMF